MCGGREGERNAVGWVDDFRERILRSWVLVGAGVSENCFERQDNFTGLFQSVFKMKKFNLLSGF